MQRFGRADWKNAAEGEARCFLLTNGLGGYSSLAVTGANTRDDHALFMGVDKAPNFRYHYVTNLHETIETGTDVYDLASQSYVAHTRDQHGYRYLQMFSCEDIPEWVFHADGFTIRKQIVMAHEANTVAVHYEIQTSGKREAVFRVRPLLKFAPKNHQPSDTQEFLMDQTTIKSDGHVLYYRTNGMVQAADEKRIRDLYFAYDARDGRNAVGTVVANHEIVFEIKGGRMECELVYSDQPSVDSFQTILDAEKKRLAALEERAGFRTPEAVRLVKSADQFLVKRDSTGGDTIIAGYPFFGDWGRDTMIALMGCATETGQYERTKSILRTFAAYCRRGLMPNMFPEGEDEPMYNTVDASLWFIEAVYEYGCSSGDTEFVREMLPVMKDIVFWYRKGTDFHIYADSDGLLMAGEGYEQVTWMDVRYEDILPTSRHGKPVEVNALWYNALCILAELSEEDGSQYEAMAEQVKKSFLEKFWLKEPGYLCDVLSLEPERAYAREQIRCNQVWALSLPYSMLDKDYALQVLETIEQELYTPYGLRSLSPKDAQFHPFCCGSQYERDLAYHQGTVWGFPLGAYLISILRWKEPQESIPEVQEKLRMFGTCLQEGCIGQVAEIYDGAFPTESRGCYAQAWSVGELLRVYRRLEMMQDVHGPDTGK